MIDSFKLCAEFSIFPVNHLLPASFSLSGMVFASISSNQQRIVGWSPFVSLGFDYEGVSIVLPSGVKEVEIDLGSGASDLTIEAFENGDTVQTRNVRGDGKIYQEKFTAPKMDKILITGGSNEGFVASVCIKIETVSSR